MTTIHISSEVKVSEELLATIIVTAVEGGINYWSQVSNYRWLFEGDEWTYDGPKPASCPFAEVTVHDMDDWNDENDGYETEGTHIMQSHIAEALQKIAGPDEIEYASTEWRQRMVTAMIEDDGGDIDSSDADNIVQIAMFGKIVYG